MRPHPLFALFIGSVGGEEGGTQRASVVQIAQGIDDLQPERVEAYGTIFVSLLLQPSL